MKKHLLFTLLFPLGLWAQKTQSVSAPIEKVTVFTEGAQVEHSKQVSLFAGKQIVTFEKLTDFIDPNSIQLKCSQNATIISVRTRKNFDDTAIAKQDVTEMNSKKRALENDEQKLRDEYKVLLLDEEFLLKNNYLGSQQQGVKITELKETAPYYHTKMTEIQTRKAVLVDEIEKVIRKINTIEQEIVTRRNLPVKNYSEIEVEIEVEKAGNTDFTFSYITQNASWKPYYDMRSNGVGAPVLLEAKGLITQNTGIEWKNVQLVLSTNDPYDNTQEPNIQPWYLEYNTPAPRKQIQQRTIATYNYSGETVHGEVLDGVTGEPLAFARISMSQNPSEIYTTDINGKFAFVVPRYEQGYTISYLGYQTQYVTINAPYTKTSLSPETIAMEELDRNERYAAEESYDLQEVTISASKMRLIEAKTSQDILRKQQRLTRKDIERLPVRSAAGVANTVGGVNQDLGYYSNSIATKVEKDLRMEFQISTPFSVPSDNADHRVSIAVYQMPASYEYHAVPKLDASVYLVAQITGWEKLSLLSGESNLYFDGTFIGKSYIDVNSTKDTLNFSLGKDKKMVVERKRVEEMSKTKSIGNRNKYDVTWEFVVRNNGAAAIPFVLKDHFPVPVNDDIKVKRGSFEGATMNEETGILTWKLSIPKGETKKIRFDYSVDYGKNGPVYLE